jgi:hypothetical protein
MKKALTFCFLMIVAVVVAAFYGVVHDQISYTVSPQYFTKFKFIQFGLTDNSLPERLRASVVGFLASWWMGIPIGLLVGSVGFIHRDYRQMLKVTLWSFVLIAAFTFLVGICGLLYDCLETRSIDLAGYGDWYIPDGLVNLRRFLCAGYMHNSSYLGGALAIPLGWIFQIAIRLRENRDAVEGSSPS